MYGSKLFYMLNEILDKNLSSFLKHFFTAKDAMTNIILRKYIDMMSDKYFFFETVQSEIFQIPW